MRNFDSLDVPTSCKEESSDESTIISSQTSTLTRNQSKYRKPQLKPRSLLLKKGSLKG